jgi:hypothetical protein
MADDIVDLLRMPVCGLYDDETGEVIPCSSCVKAADEIERLRLEVSKWRKEHGKWRGVASQLMIGAEDYMEGGYEMQLEKGMHMYEKALNE